jgi:hypothetical protein
MQFMILFFIISELFFEYVSNANFNDVQNL